VLSDHRDCIRAPFECRYGVPIQRRLTVGGMVGVGDTILLILQGADRLVVEARVAPQHFITLMKIQKASVNGRIQFFAADHAGGIGVRRVNR
jgi:hypothetical protein